MTKLGDQSKAWTLDENSQTLRGTSSLIVATWDTMGWVLFREKKMSEAKGYLEAAWLNRQDAVVGEHLGDVLVAQGERDKAEKVYELALASVPKYDVLGRKTEKDSPIETRLRGKVKVASKGVVAEANALQQMRKIPLGPAAGKNGTAEYKMLISASGIERAVPTGEKDLAGGSDLLKKVRLAGFWPEKSEARLVRVGMLNCHSGTCELVLEP